MESRLPVGVAGKGGLSGRIEASSAAQPPSGGPPPLADRSRPTSVLGRRHSRRRDRSPSESRRIPPRLAEVGRKGARERQPECAQESGRSGYPTKSTSAP